MRALIADDEVPARARLRRALASSGDIEVVGEAGTGREAVALVKRLSPDIVFLDIGMPGLDGFGVLDAIGTDRAPYVVFVTANEAHALKAFEVGAVDYLLKPYTTERFDRVIQRARERLAASDAPRATDGPSFLERILVVADGRALLLRTDAIDRLESERNYVRIVAGKAEHRMRTTLQSLADRLEPSRFLRINRSTIVRIDAVQEMHEWSHGDYRVVMRDGTELMWSRRYRADAERRFGVKP